MLLRESFRIPDRRIRAGLSLLFIAIIFECVGLLPPGLAGSVFWSGLVHGVSVVLLASGIFLSVSGASGRKR